jgi:pimeloyl-ACP methyl ester carboxylesterase
VAIDVPGFGESPPLAGEPTVVALAEAIADFARAELGGEPIDVGGHSMGGQIALELAKLGVARRVVAVAPVGFWTPLEAAYSKSVLRFTAWMARSHGALLKAGFARPRSRVLLLANQFAHPARIPAAPLQHMADVLAGAPGWDATLEAMHAGRFEDGDRVGVPTTIVWGNRDGLLLPPQARRAAAAIPGAELVWVRPGAHFAHWDDPDLTIRALLGR